MQDHSPTRDHVVRLFEDWRENRPGKRAIPDIHFCTEYYSRPALSGRPTRGPEGSATTSKRAIPAESLLCAL